MTCLLSRPLALEDVLTIEVVHFTSSLPIKPINVSDTTYQCQFLRRSSCGHA
jgi:hypothetical protein